MYTWAFQYSSATNSPSSWGITTTMGSECNRLFTAVEPEQTQVTISVAQGGFSSAVTMKFLMGSYFEGSLNPLPISEFGTVGPRRSFFGEILELNFRMNGLLAVVGAKAALRPGGNRVVVLPLGEILQAQILF